jgi:hypothetical protein
LARFSQGEAEKGSQKWIQILVNQKQDFLNQQIRTSLSLPENEEIKWRSPLAEKNYKEYKDQEFLDALKIEPEEIKLHDFWPNSGPRWDALAKSSSNKLFLVEAKSHVTELISDFKGTKQTSVTKIQNSLNATKKRFSVESRYDWTKTFYQYANRLAHIYFLTANGFDAKLLSIYFLNDVWKDAPKSKEEWKGAIRLLHRCSGLRENLLNNYVVDLFIDVSKLE